MSNKEKTREILEEMLSRFSNGDEVDDIIDDAIAKLHPPKVKKEIRWLIGNEQIDGDELEEFKNEPLGFIEGFSYPSFSTVSADDTPDAFEGEEIFIKVNNQYYSFTTHRGTCVEATWDGVIYEQWNDNFKLVDDPELEKYKYKLY
jgi:hypothetical protein